MPPRRRCCARWPRWPTGRTSCAPHNPTLGFQSRDNGFMANTLDLQEQEQLDDLKAFWKRWGNLITWVITACLLAFASWNAWGWYQRDQAAKAAAMFEELDKAASAGDAERVGRIFNDMKERFPGTTL